MNRTYDYQRRYRLHRQPNRIIDLEDAGIFNEIPYVNCEPVEETSISGRIFHSFHAINAPRNKRIFTAYRSDEEPGILLSVWRGIPFNLHIEEGGDIMLQILHADKRVKHLIIDNTYVMSPWMTEKKTVEYLKNGWLPGLIQLGLKGFCHIQARKLLGKMSFEQFGSFLENTVSETAERLGKRQFTYYPITTSELNTNGTINDDVPNSALAKAFHILNSM